MEPDLDELLPEGAPMHRRSRESRFSPEVARARHKESTWRATNARRLAAEALRRLHPDDYESLTVQARARIDAQRGPLPGDEEENHDHPNLQHHHGVPDHP